MLDRVLLFVRDSLDLHLRRSFSMAESLVTLDRFHDSAGGTSTKIQNKMIMTMVKLEYESSRQYYNRPSSANISVTKSPPQFFNLNVLFAANFDDYVESLKILSSTLSFFQSNSHFDRAQHPTLPNDIGFLDIEVENSSEAQSFELWSALGAKYVPSVVYKVRRIAVDGDQISRMQPAVGQPLVELW